MLATGLLLSGTVRAQDTRKVREPAFPPSCTVLRARLVSEDGRTLRAGDEHLQDTLRIQRALDHCTRGQAVVLAPDGSKNAFLSGPLNLPNAVTLQVGQGAILFASRDPRDYDLKPGSCGVLSTGGHACKALINVTHAAGAAVMGPGIIDGRGWASLLGEKTSWWELAQDAKVKNLDQNCPFLILANQADNFTLYRITLRNAPMYHVYYRGGNGFTAWGVVIDTPRTARNTDGIDPSSATNVTIAHCSISDGDDDVAIKAGGSGPASHITVADNQFGSGHGMSIGSETYGGVSAVRVTNLSIDGADNGIRIKSNSSRGGQVHGILYRNISIRDTKNPILITTSYPFFGKARNRIPSFSDITLREVCVEGSGRITLDGYDRAHPLKLKLDGVLLDAPNAFEISASYADISLGPGPVNFLPQGKDVKVSGAASKARGCTAGAAERGAP